MQVISNLITVLEQLKSDPARYNLTSAQLERLEEGLKLLKAFKREDRFYKGMGSAAKLLAVVKIIYEIVTDA